MQNNVLLKINLFIYLLINMDIQSDFQLPPMKTTRARLSDGHFVRIAHGAV